MRCAVKSRPAMAVSSSSYRHSAGIRPVSVFSDTCRRPDLFVAPSSDSSSSRTRPIWCLDLPGVSDSGVRRATGAHGVKAFLRTRLGRTIVTTSTAGIRVEERRVWKTRLIASFDAAMSWTSTTARALVARVGEAADAQRADGQVALNPVVEGVLVTVNTPSIAAPSPLRRGRD